MKNITYIKLVILLTIGSCILVGLANYVVDPYGKNNVIRAEFNNIKIIKDERISKFEMLRAYPEADSFIFGSSRGLILNPYVVENSVGGVALNMSFSSATAEEYLLYVRYLFDTRKVSNIIIGIDLFAYADGFDSTGTLPQGLRDYYGLDNQYPVTNYISLKMFKKTIKTIKHNSMRVGKEIDDRYTDKGQILVKQYLDARKDRVSFETYIQDHVINKPARWATRYDNLDQSRLDSLNEIKRICQDNGANLYLFMSPLYIKQITMKENKFFLQKRLLEYIVKNISPVMDFNAVDSVNSTATNYLDEFHYSYDMVDSILSQMLTGVSLYKESTGVYVEKSNIDAYIQQVNHRYLNYDLPNVDQAAQ